MKRFGTALRAFVLVTLVACDGDGAQQATQQQPLPDDGRNTTFSQDSLRDWFIEFGLVGIPETETELLATVGVADSVLRLGSANVQDPVAFDTIIEVYYPGLIVSLLKKGGGEALQSVWVADTTFLIGPIRPGVDSLTLTRRLGPSMVSGVRPGYICASCSYPNQAALFDMLDGRISAIQFTFPAR